MLPAGYKGLRILIVDDVAATRILLRGVLIHLGLHQIIECKNREDAFEAVQSAEPDLVITDWEMPGGTGLDLIGDIRNDDRSPDPTLPVILLTSHGGKEQVIRGRDAGATDFLVKPFTPKSIQDRIIEVVDRQRANVITSTYRGPDRRRAQRPVLHDQRSSAPRNDVLVMPPDNLLQAKVSGDARAVAVARMQRTAAARIFHREAGQLVNAAGEPVAVAPAAPPGSLELAGLIELALGSEDRWDRREILTRMISPLDHLLHATGLSMPPALLRVARLFEGFAADPVRAERDPELTRLLLMTMRAMLRIGRDNDAEQVATALAGQVEILAARRVTI